jgi:hypothetical protein
MSQSPKRENFSEKKNILMTESPNPIIKNEKKEENNKKRNSFSNILNNKNFIEKKNIFKGDSSPNYNYYYNSSPIVDYYSGITINHNYYTPDDIYKKKEDFFEKNNINSKTMPFSYNNNNSNFNLENKKKQ